MVWSLDAIPVAKNHVKISIDDHKHYKCDFSTESGEDMSQKNFMKFKNFKWFIPYFCVNTQTAVLLGLRLG